MNPPNDLQEWKAIDPNRQGERLYLSVSSMKTYNNCPKAWQLQYHAKMGRALAPTLALDTGNIVHAVLEWVNNYYIEHGKYPTDDEWLPVVTAQVKEHEQFLSPTDRWKVELLSMRLVGQYLKGIGQDMEPVTAEMKFLLEGPRDVRIYGFMDVTEADTVFDYKVTYQAVANAGLHADQLNIYSVAFYAITGIWPGVVGILNLVKQDNSVRMLALDQTPESVKRTLDNALSVYDNVLARKFDPQVGPICKDCSFSKGVCEEGSRYVKANVKS